ncbi:MAG: hypothetical protein WC543_05885 [Candidatus Omnitrophota bacterium]
MPNRNKKGVIFFIVISVVVIASLLAIAVLRVVSNQARLTHHQLSRIQAQYAAKAAVILALDKLRQNDVNWGSGVLTKRMCKSTTTAPGCDAADVILDSDLPNSIQWVDITVEAAPGTGPSGTRRVSAKTTYTYTP